MMMMREGAPGERELQGAVLGLFLSPQVRMTPGPWPYPQRFSFEALPCLEMSGEAGGRLMIVGLIINQNKNTGKTVNILVRVHEV